MTLPVDPEHVVLTEAVVGSDLPVHLMYLETMDGLYAPIGLRKPPGDGPFPVVLLASGNGGGGMGWVRDAVHHRGVMMDRLLAAGYACAWLRYRNEVELGYHRGGPLERDVRTGRTLFNRAPLEYEDEIAIVEQVKTLPFVHPDRIGLVGMSHGGEMVLKLTAEHHGVAVAVASEPAAHEFLAYRRDPDVRIDETNVGTAQTVRARIDADVARRRIAPISTPILVMGRDADDLQGIFRLTYELLAEAGKDVAWVSYAHPWHGYVFPLRDQVDALQEQAMAGVIAYLDRHLKP